MGAAGAGEMLNLEEVPFEYRVTPERVVRILRFLWRYRSDPEALEPFLASAREEGIPDPNLSNVRAALVAWRDVYLGLQGEIVYRIDKYLLAGIAVIDVMLIPVLLPMGVPDYALTIALLSLLFSGILVCWSLIIAFMKSGLGITSYGKIHGGLTFLGLVFGVTALAATVWHFSPPIAIAFAALAVIAYVACSSYLSLAQLAIGFAKIAQSQQTAPEPDTGEFTSEWG